MSNAVSTTDDLDDERHTRIRHREWKAERLGWLCLFLIVTAALCGLFGRGALTERRVASPDGAVTVRYSAVERRASPIELEVEVDGSGTDRIRIGFSRELIGAVEHTELVPPPATVAASAERIDYTFLRADSTRARQLIRMRYKSDSSGRLRGVVFLDGEPKAEIEQLILP